MSVTIIPANPGFNILTPVFDMDSRNLSEIAMTPIIGWVCDEDGVVTPLTSTGRHDGPSPWIRDPNGLIESVDGWTTSVREWLLVWIKPTNLRSDQRWSVNEPVNGVITISRPAEV